MADDRMKNDMQNDDFNRNMGNKEGQDFGQQSPGRTGQQGVQHAGGGQETGGQFGGGQKDARNFEDDEEFGAGGANKTGGQNRGDQNR